jgi:hypothetical protein
MTSAAMGKVLLSVEFNVFANLGSSAVNSVGSLAPHRLVGCVCEIGLSLDRRETQIEVSISIINHPSKALNQNNF